MSRAASSSALFSIALGVLAAAGVAAVLFCTPWGVGVTPDSVMYIGGARGLLAGQGYAMLVGDDEYRHLITYPPGFPFVIAAVSAFGGDPLQAARFIQAVLFGFNIALVGLLIRVGMRGSIGAAIVGAAFFLLSPDMNRIHAIAWSEPLFVTLILSAAGLLAWHLERPRAGTLIACGVLLGLAYLTRYAGMAFIAAATITVLLLSRQHRRRGLIQAGIMLAPALMVVVLWSIRNQLIDAPARRPIAWHPITVKHLQQGLATLGGWFRPDGSFTTTGLTLAAIGAIVGVAIGLRNENSGMVGTRAATRHPLILLTILWMMIYVGFLVVVISLFDSGIPLDRRLLSPVFALALVAVVALIGSALSFARWRAVRMPAMAVLLSLLALNAAASLRQAQEIRRNGIGYASPQWKQSQTMQALARLPRDARVYTNGRDVVWLYLQRRTTMLPAKSNLITDRPNDHVKSQVQGMGEQMRRGALIVLFKNIVRPNLVGERELRSWLPLRAAQTLQDGVIYQWDQPPSNQAAAPQEKPDAPVSPADR